MIKLYINNEEVDVNQDTVNVTVNYSIESSELGNIKGSHSKRNIELPATKKNKGILENIEIPESISSEAYKLFDARLEANGVTILVGKAKLESADLNAIYSGFEAKNYKLSLIGNNADWFADVGNVLVRSLGWGDLELSTANIKTNYNPLTNEACFILLKWHAWENETYVIDEEFSPAIFVWQILEKAFKTKGYQLLSIFKNDPFNRLIIPFPSKLDKDYIQQFVNIRASNPSPSSFVYSSGDYGTATITFTDETTAPNFDNAGNYTGGTYTAPITALYEINAELNIILTATIGDLNQFAQLVLIYDVNGSTVAVFDFSSYFDQVINDSVEFYHLIELNAGDTVTMKLTYENVSFGLTLAGSFTITAEQENIQKNESYNLQYIIPITWYVKDVIKDITNIFNLAWETDVQNKIVYAYPKDDYTIKYRANSTGAITQTTNDGFFKDSSTYDLQFRDIEGAELSLIDGYKSTQVLAYATDDDTTNKEEERRSVNIYSAGYNFPQDRFENGIEFIYTSFFAKLMHINDVAITSGGTYGAQIPLLFGEDYNTVQDAAPNYSLAPRLLYYAGRRNGLDGYVRLFDDTSSAASAFDFPQSFMVNYNDPSGGDFNLSFSDEVTNYSAVMQGVFKSFHLQNYKRIEVGKIYNTDVKWNVNEIAQLSFRNKGKIGASNYLIQSLEYNSKSNRPSKTVILFDTKPSVTDLAKVTNTISLAGANAQTATVTGSGSGLVGANGATVNIQLSYSPFLDSQTNVLELNANSGITNVSNTNANVLVFQNGQKLIPQIQYIISASTIGININTHYDGANYEVIVNGVTKG